MSVIEVNNISKTFKLSKKQQQINKSTETLKTAVDGLSFSVNKGEIYGLLGPNGAGKTTTLRILSTLINADFGEINIDGINIKDDPHRVRQNIAFLTSELKLEEYFTPNYLYNFYSNLHGVDEVTREKRKKELFEKFEVTKFSEVKVGDLSTGMKQKASLAISLVHDPKIIIFDEPTNGLDVLTAKVVTDFLIELKRLGKTIIVSTHIFSLIEKVCDRVGIIFDGKMKVDAVITELCRDKNLEDVFFEIYENDLSHKLTTGAKI